MTKRRFIPTVVIIGLTVCPPTAQQWKVANGPQGTWIGSVAINGSTLFAGTPYDGIFRSTDNGRSWQSTGGLLRGTIRGSNVHAFAAIGNYVYAGFQDYGGIVRSTDNGVSWSEVEGVPPEGVSGNFTINSFTGYDNFVFAHVSSGSDVLLRSADNGRSWTTISCDGLPNSTIRTIRATDTLLFAGLHGKGVYRSADNGDTWTEANNGLTDSIVTSLEVTGRYLFAATFGGVHRSTDNGDSWLPVNNDTMMHMIELLAAGGNTLYGATYGGLYRSTNDGQSWSKVYERMNLQISNLAVSGNRVLAGTDRGVYGLIDHGRSVEVNFNGLVPVDVNCLTERNDVVYAGTRLGVYRSFDNGASWEVENDSFMIDVGAIALSDSMIFCSPDDGEGGVFRSPRNKATWTYLEKLQWGFLKFLVNDSFLYGSNDAMYGRGLFRSSDNGVSWEGLRNGLPETGHSALFESDGVIYTGSPYGIFSSTDNGASWSCSWELSGKADKTGYVSAMTACGSTLFAGVSAYFCDLLQAKIIVSNDRGVTWRASWSSNYDHCRAPNISALVADERIVIAGLTFQDSIGANSSAGEVLVSTDKGVSWHAFNDGLPNRDIRALLLRGSTLYAGFSAEEWGEGPRGLYRLELGELPLMSNSRYDGGAHRSGLRCAAVNGGVCITYTVPAPGMVRLNVYSLAGRRIASLVDGIRPAGFQTVMLNAETAPSGTYVVRIETGLWQEEKTFVNAR